MFKLPQVRWNAWRVGTKVNVTLIALTSFFLASMFVGLNVLLKRQFEERITRDVTQQVQVMQRMIEAAEQDQRRHIDQLAKALSARLQGHIEIGAGTAPTGNRAVTTVLFDGRALNGDHRFIDDFSRDTTSVATVFVKSGDEFVRVTTSVKTDQGERADGTALAANHPAQALLRRGESYVGSAVLFGRRYVTRYDPLRDAKGQVIGAAFVGLDFSAQNESIKAALRSVKIGNTGYFYVLGSAQGDDYGRLLVHPFIEGKSVLDQRDADGNDFIRPMLEKPEGTSRYPWVNSAAQETSARDKVASHVHIKAWDWVLVGGAYVDDYAADLTAMRMVYGGCVVSFLVVFVLACRMLLARLVARPLAQAEAAGMAFAQGDLHAFDELATTDRQDEVGMLFTALGSVGCSMAMVVEMVRQNADHLSTSSVEIAQGNQDLSDRTEQQAAALERTVSSMTELGETVQRNAEHAQVATQLAQEASRVAGDGGQVVSNVVDTMRGISDSAKRIAEIISVMDGISFQTNILALNAAVEAARAGESGRGFAVVAGEVRSLANRSAEAAREIRGLIQDSVERTEAGSDLVNRAGTTMAQVEQSIQRVTDLMTEISHASRDQRDGVGQVSQAITQIDQATQQNAALVEQMAAAAASLRSQAEELVGSVEIFKA